jgi:hypothetical protein
MIRRRSYVPLVDLGVICATSIVIAATAAVSCTDFAAAPPGLFHSSLERSPPLEPVKPSVAVKYWEIIADNLSKAGWSWGCVSAVDFDGQTIFIADAHRGIWKRFVVWADERLTPLIELESVIRAVRR